MLSVKFQAPMDSINQRLKLRDKLSSQTPNIKKQNKTKNTFAKQKLLNIIFQKKTYQVIYLTQVIQRWISLT